MDLSKITKSKTILIVILLIASFLRLWKLNQVPVSLFGDELDVGYHAYSILKTGQDYSDNTWPIHFQSLAEWRTPLYLYASVPTVAIFGITPFGVRLPAAIFGILGVLVLYLLVKQIFNNEKLALISAGVMTFSPWAIQYSRAGFEVTQLLFFLLLGLWLFFKSLKDQKLLWLSLVCLTLTPWVYSTAKLFTPLLLFFLFCVWGKQILKYSKKYLIFAVCSLILVGAPIAYSTLFGGGAARFSYISIFTDPTTEPEVGSARQLDARVRGELGEGLMPTPIDKLFHNKFTFWGRNVLNNYYQSLSFDFLFNEGDPNPRHSPNGIGEFYKLEIIPLILGIILFFGKSKEKKLKLLIGFWILAGIIPAAITRDGGRHATRLILILPPLVFLVAYGLYFFSELVQKKYRLILNTSYLILFLFSFIFYQHQLFVHNPWTSERWWHGGWQESIQSIKQVENDYDKIVITSADEPPWIFFAAHYMYDPIKWHQGYPFKKLELKGFGEVSFIDKFYFGTPTDNKGLYDWGQVLDNKTLYLASAKEVRVNLILEPERTPGDLKLLKSIAYPSGEPAFYLFTGK